MTNRWLGATLWGAAVLAAVGAGGVAVAAASGDGGQQVLSRAAVDRQLKALPAVSPGPIQAGSAGASPAPVRIWTASGLPTPTWAQTLHGPGGTIVVACTGGVATLVAWIPASGYRDDDPKLGPAATVSVRFESKAKDVLDKAHCSATDTAILVSTVETDDHGGGGPSTPLPGGGGNAPQPGPSTAGPVEGGPSPSPSADDHGGSGKGSGKGDPSPHQ